MTTSEITTHYIWYRMTDADGKVTLAQALVWSSDDSKGARKFIEARQAECDGANTDALRRNKPAKASVQQITEEQFRKENAR